MAKIRAAFATAALFVAACAGSDRTYEVSPGGYLQDPAKWLAEVDWENAETVTLVLDEFSFKPAELKLVRGRAYRLVMRNRGAMEHSFASEGFFRAIATDRLSEAGQSRKVAAVDRIVIPQGEEKTLTFVAVEAGRFPYECAVFLHDSFGMEGAITIE